MKDRDNITPSFGEGKQKRMTYASPYLIVHGSLEKITESVMLPNSRDANMAGCQQGA
jgi:hypothetical protein